MPIFVMHDGVVPATVSFIETHSITTDNLGTYNHTGRNIGPAAADRYVLIAASTRAFTAVGTISSVTINGVSASFVSGVTNGTNRLEFWGAIVPSGSTGVTVTVVWSNSDQSFSKISILNINSLQSATPTHTPAGSTASPGSVSLNVNAGGVGVACAVAAVSTAMAWTGLSEVDDTTTDIHSSVAATAFATAQSGLSVTSTFTGSPIGPVTLAAAFR